MREEGKTETEIGGEVENGMKFLEIQAKDFEEKADGTENPLKKSNYEMYKERAEFEADRMRTNLLKTKPVHPQTEKAIQTETDNNPKVGFEKYKYFVKRNFIGISGLLIGLAGVIATIVFAIRSGVKKAGKFNTENRK